MCGSCAMVVNGRPRWTCRTRVSEAVDRRRQAPARAAPQFHGGEGPRGRDGGVLRQMARHRLIGLARDHNVGLLQIALARRRQRAGAEQPQQFRIDRAARCSAGARGGRRGAPARRGRRDSHRPSSVSPKRLLSESRMLADVVRHVRSSVQIVSPCPSILSWHEGSESILSVDVWRGAAEGRFQTFAGAAARAPDHARRRHRDPARPGRHAVLSLRLPRRHVRLLRHGGERPSALDLPHPRQRGGRRRRQARSSSRSAISRW